MRRLATAAAMLAVSGCLPDRDNLNDPQNRPTAVLTVLTADVERDSLGHPISPETCSTVTSSFPDGGASRGRCLLATSTGSEAEDGLGFTSAFSVTWLDSANQLVDEPMPSTGADGVLSPTELRGFPLVWTAVPSQGGLFSAPLTVHLEVEDDLGAKSSVSTDVVLTNAAPVAEKRGHITVPVYGALWDFPTGVDGASVLDVHLDGGNSSDADDDPLFYCWSGSSVTSTTCNIDDPLDANASPWAETPQGLATVVFPLEQGSTDAKLRVFDGVVTSAKAGAGIVIASTPSWGVDKSGNAVILDLNRQTYPIASSGPAEDPLAGGAFFPNVATWPNRLVAATGDGSQVRAWAVGSSAGGPVLDFPSTQRVLALEADPIRGLAWAAVAEDIGALAPTLRVYVLEFNPPESTTLVIRDDWAPAIGAPILGNLPTLVTEGSGTPITGVTEMWIAPQFGDRAFALRFDHATNAITEIRDYAVPAGRMITALDLRKSGDVSEMIIVDAVDALSGGNASEPAFTRIQRGTGEWTEETYGLFVLPGVDMAGLQPWSLRFYSRTPGSENDAWANLFGVGLASLTFSTSVGQNSPELVLDVLAPTTQTGFDLSVNELSGRALLVHGGRRGFSRALRDGAIAEVETVSRVLGVWEDLSVPGEVRVGSVWTLLDREGTITPRIAIGEGSGSEGFLLRATVFPGYDAYTIDYSSGELWAGSIVPPGLSRVQIDGKVTDFVSALDDDASPETAVYPPPATWLASEPDGGTIWMLAASDPTYGGADLFYRFDPNAVRTDNQVGLVAPGLSFPPSPNAMLGLGAAPDEYATRAFAIPASNDLIVATFENFSSTGHLRRIDGTTGELVGASVDADPTVTSSVVSRDLLDGGICAASVVPGSQLRLARYDSTLVQQYAIVVTGGFLSVLSSAAGNEECWTGIRTGAGNQVVLWRPGSAPFAVAGGGVPTPRSILAFLDPSLKKPGNTPPYFQSQAWVSGDTQMMRLVVDTSGGPSVLRIDEIIDTTSEVLLVQP